MAGPMLSAPVSATQMAQQNQLDQGNQLKQGASKFDGVMANKASAAQATQQATATQATSAAQQASSTTAAQKVQHARMVESLQKTDAAKFHKVDANQGAQKAGNQEQNSEFQVLGQQSAGPASGAAQASGSPALKMMGDIEKGQGVLDQLIKMGASGKQFSNGELISMQAMVYKYTQELELTGKVVEKATTGLKDTLKTQV